METNIIRHQKKAGFVHVWVELIPISDHEKFAVNRLERYHSDTGLPLSQESDTQLIKDAVAKLPGFGTYTIEEFDGKDDDNILHMKILPS